MIWLQPNGDGFGSMLTAIIATRESERILVPTLAALVPGAMAGLLTEVIVADAGSRDATAEVTDIAGCRFMSDTAPVGARLKAAAETARAPWLLFLRAGAVPEPGWISAAENFMGKAAGTDRLQAAVFRPAGRASTMRPGLSEFLTLLRAAFGGGPTPAQGLLIAKSFYVSLGGHPQDEDGEAALLRGIGRRRLVMRPATMEMRT